MVNHVILVGNLTRDAEPLSTTGRAMTRMRLATNSSWRDAEGNRRETPEFHSVVCFARLAEIAALYCTKGRRIYIEGRIRTREYEGQDGMRRTSTEIVAENFRLLSGFRPNDSEGEADAPTRGGEVVALPVEERAAEAVAV